MAPAGARGGAGTGGRRLIGRGGRPCQRIVRGRPADLPGGAGYNGDAARAAYLEAACGGDAALRGEVEALLGDPESGDGFLETPPWAPAPTLLVGQRLGPYEIQSALGAGGMGEVYKARDTRLDRTVAIKILPSAVSADAERRARFEREAKTIASLSHPHICPLYDIGDHEGAMFLVMEHLVGQTLAARLEKGPLPLRQALPIAAEIADALAAAHRQGIIHRDLKPANVMLTKTGAKLLDFGLAKLARHGEQPAALYAVSAGPAEAATITGQGAIVGTLHYMAPEQVEGRPSDARTDLWALGAIVYEMVTGKRAFEGTSAASVMSAILDREPPPLTAIQPLAPPLLDRLVRQCLAKSPDDRPDGAHDVADELRWLVSESGRSATGGATPSRRARGWTLAFLALAAVGVTGALMVRWNAAQHTVSRPVHASILLAASGLTLETGPGGIALSPDGRTLVFVASRPNEPSRLWMRRLTDEQPVPLPETDGAALPFFSFDGQEVAYFVVNRGSLYRLSLNGGTAQWICDAVEFQGGTWSRDGVIVYAGGYAKPGLWAVSEQGGKPKKVDETPSDAAGWYTFPDLLPDGKTVLFSNGNSLNAWSPGTGVKRVMDGGRCRYLASGHLIYEAGVALREVGFDASRLEPIGRPRTVVQKTRTGDSTTMWAVSEDVLVYAPPYTGIGRLVWKERDGKTTALPLKERAYLRPSISRQDGHRLVVSGVWPGAGLLTGSTDREPLQPLVPGQFGSMPSFTWDGRWVLYTGVDAHGWFNIFRAPADGSGKPQQLTQGRDAKGVATSSPDGTVLLLHAVERDGRVAPLGEAARIAGIRAAPPRHERVDQPGRIRKILAGRPPGRVRVGRPGVGQRVSNGTRATSLERRRHLARLEPARPRAVLQGKDGDDVGRVRQREPATGRPTVPPEARCSRRVLRRQPRRHEVPDGRAGAGRQSAGAASPGVELAGDPKG